MPSFDDKQKALEKAQKRREVLFERETRRMYQDIIKGVLGDVSAIYARLEKDELTYEDMAKFNRLDSLVKQIETRSKLLTQRRRNALLKYLSDAFRFSYEYMAFGIETAAMAYLNYTSVTTEQILASVNNPVKGLTLNETLEKNRRDIIATIRSTVTQALVRGSSYSSMAKELKTVFEGDYKKAIRVSRTEAHRVVEQGKSQAVQRAASQGVVMMKKWNSSRDSRVRKTSKANHRKMDGQTVKADEQFNLGRGIKADAPGTSGVAAHDINCRCFVTYTVERVEKKEHAELASMTYEEWRKVRLK